MSVLGNSSNFTNIRLIYILVLIHILTYVLDMTKSQIENWALRIADAISKGQNVEDSHVECKSKWPEADYKTARRVAGLCNAARGEPALLLIGVNERNGSVDGANDNEISNWWSKLSAYFDGVAPELRELTIPVESKTIVALQFETDRAPFVIKNDQYGNSGCAPIERETPWREGTSVRTARREDLLRIIVPAATVPQIDILNGFCSKRIASDSPETFTYHISISTYFLGNLRTLYLIPFHRCHFTVSTISGSILFEGQGVEAAPPQRQLISFREARPGFENLVDSHTVQSTSSEITINGAGRVDYTISQKSNSDISASEIENLIISIHVYISPIDRIISMTSNLEKTSDIRWGMIQSHR